MEEINKFEDTNGKQAAIAIFWRFIIPTGACYSSLVLLETSCNSFGLMITML